MQLPPLHILPPLIVAFENDVDILLNIDSLSNKKMATSYLLSHKHFWKNARPLKMRMKEDGIIQQSDYLKEFLLLIQRGGLEAAYEVYGDDYPRPPPNLASFKDKQEFTHEYDVIVVGAGVAGLSAAYELKKAGFTVKILEQTGRYGGRLFSYGEESGLKPGLYGEGIVYLVWTTEISIDKKYMHGANLGFFKHSF